MADYRSPEVLMRAFFDALARHDFARAAGAIAESCHWQSMRERLAVSGNVVVAEGDTSGTFHNPFRGQPRNDRARLLEQLGLMHLLARD
jgi:hypothetical protein